jgi:hypothetical protein
VDGRTASSRLRIFVLGDSSLIEDGNSSLIEAHELPGSIWSQRWTTIAQHPGQAPSPATTHESSIRRERASAKDVQKRALAHKAAMWSNSAIVRYPNFSGIIAQLDADGSAVIFTNLVTPNQGFTIYFVRQILGMMELELSFIKNADTGSGTVEVH